MKLFVYGTLLSGLERAHLLPAGSYCGKASCAYALFDLGPYPGMVELPGQTFGELYAVDQETIERLDEEEEYFPNDPKKSLYLRKEVAVCLDDGAQKLTANTYLYNGQPPLTALIADGDYRRFRGTKQ